MKACHRGRSKLEQGWVPMKPSQPVLSMLRFLRALSAYRLILVSSWVRSIWFWKDRGWNNHPRDYQWSFWALISLLKLPCLYWHFLTPNMGREALGSFDCTSFLVNARDGHPWDILCPGPAGASGNSDSLIVFLLSHPQLVRFPGKAGVFHKENNGEDCYHKSLPRSDLNPPWTNDNKPDCYK